MTLCCVVLIALISGVVWGAGLLPQMRETKVQATTPLGMRPSPAASATAVQSSPASTSGTSTPVVATPNAQPSPSPVPSYPELTSHYAGTISNQFTTPSTDSSMALSQLQQDGTAIRGYFSVGAGLVGNGNFAGTVTVDSKIQFLVPGYAGLLPLFFTGQIQKDGSISGSYCSYQNNRCNYAGGGHGIWHVTPS